MAARRHKTRCRARRACRRFYLLGAGEPKKAAAGNGPRRSLGRPVVRHGATVNPRPARAAISHALGSRRGRSPRFRPSCSLLACAGGKINAARPARSEVAVSRWPRQPRTRHVHGRILSHWLERGGVGKKDRWPRGGDGSNPFFSRPRGVENTRGMTKRSLLTRRAVAVFLSLRRVRRTTLPFYKKGPGKKN